MQSDQFQSWTQIGVYNSYADQQVEDSAKEFLEKGAQD